MLDTALFATVAQELMSARSGTAGAPVLRIGHTSAQRLRTATFRSAGREYCAIEQNPEKPSRWGQLAREGHQVVQFKDVETNRFVAVAVDGEVHVYGEKRSARGSS